MCVCVCVCVYIYIGYDFFSYKTVKERLFVTGI